MPVLLYKFTKLFDLHVELILGRRRLTQVAIFINSPLSQLLFVNKLLIQRVLSSIELVQKLLEVSVLHAILMLLLFVTGRGRALRVDAVSLQTD